MVRAAALNYLAEQALEKVAPLLAPLAEKKMEHPSSLKIVQESMERLQPRESQPAFDIPIKFEVKHEVIGGGSDLPKLRRSTD